MEELTSENAELKTSLMESRGEILRSSIVTLERKNSKLRNKVCCNVVVAPLRYKGYKIMLFLSFPRKIFVLSCHY